MMNNYIEQLRAFEARKPVLIGLARQVVEDCSRDGVLPSAVVLRQVKYTLVLSDPQAGLEEILVTCRTLPGMHDFGHLRPEFVHKLHVALEQAKDADEARYLIGTVHRYGTYKRYLYR